MPKIRQFIERTGIYIFFISLILSTQISWMKRHNIYKDIELRLILGFLVGMGLSFGIIELIKKITGKINTEQKTFLSKLSVALSPGILFLFLSINKIFLIVGAVLSILLALYIWVKPFRDYVKQMVATGNLNSVLTIDNGKAVIDIEGTYEKDNLQIKQSFLIDLLGNFYECSEMNLDEIKIDFSSLKSEHKNELKQIIEPIAKYYNLRISEGVQSKSV